MAANNIINWEWLLETGRIQEAAPGDDYILVGSFDAGNRTKSTSSRTRDYAIKVEDFLAQGGGITPGQDIEVCDITLTPIQVQLGPLVSYHNPGGFGALADVLIPGALEINRNDDGSIWNQIFEFNSFSNFPNSPLYTEWNADGWGTLDDTTTRTYNTFWDVTNDGVNYDPVGKELILHDIPSDRYWKIWFTLFTVGPRTGEFSWEREEILATDPCRVTFSDGSFMETAPVTPVDANTWNMRNVAFVEPVNGNDSTGVVGNGNLPFRTTGAAFAASNWIWLLPGTYYGTTVIPTGVSYMHAPTGVVFGSSSRIQDTSNNNNEFTMTGGATFGDFSYGITNAGNCIMNITCDRFDNVRTVFFNTGTGTVNLSCNSVLANCFNGGAYGITARGSSKSNVNVKNFYHSQHIICSFFQMTDGAEFYMTCPDIKIIANYTSNYGNAGKTMWNISNSSGTQIIEINGRCENISPGIPVGESVVKVENQYSNTVMTINGGMYGGSGSCFRPWYRAGYGTFTFNGDMISDGPAILSAITGWSGVALVEAHIKNGRISQGASSVIGRGKEFFFSNCVVEQQAATNVFVANLGGNGTADPKLYTYNCSMESASAGLSETFFGFSGTSVIGCVDTNSTEPYGAGSNADSFAPSGFTQVTGLVVPKF